MKRLIGIVLFSWAAILQARPAFYPSIGVTKPMAGPESFKESYRAGANVGFMVGYKLTERLEVTGAVSLHNFTFAVDRFQATREEPNISDFLISGEPANVVTALALARLYLPPTDRKAVSYVYAGPGLFYLKTQDIQGIGPTESEDFVVPGRSELTLGLAGGLGVEVTFETTTLFVSLGVVVGMTGGERTVIFPLQFGIAIK